MSNFSMKLISIGLFFLAFMFLVQLVPKDVGAVSSIAPHASDYNGGWSYWNTAGNDDNHFVTLLANKGAGLTANSVVSIYLRSTSGTITIYDVGTCSDGTGPNAGAGNTFYQLESYFPAAGVVFDSWTEGTTCGNRTRNVNLPASSAITVGDQTFYAFKLRANKDSTNGGNSFRVAVNGGTANGYVSFYSRSGTEFTLQDRRTTSGTPGAYRFTDMHLYFATPCTYSGGNANLLWYDDDWGPTSPPVRHQRNFVGENFRIELIERDRTTNGVTRTWRLPHSNNSSTWTFPSTTGFMGAAGVDYPLSGAGTVASATFDARADRKYEWIWYDVRKVNGIQFQVPFDSVNYLFDCPDEAWNHTVTMDVYAMPQARNGAGDWPVYPGQTFRIGGRVRNNPADARSDAHRQYIEVASGNFSANLRKNSGAAGSTFSWLNSGLDPGATGPLRQGTYRVNNNVAPGQRICFRSRVNPAQANSSGTIVTANRNSPNTVCVVTVRNTYNYDPLTTITTGGPYYAGTSVGVRGTISNILSPGRGHPYTASVVESGPNVGFTSGGNRTWAGQGGLVNGSPRSHNTSFNISSAATHNAQICFTTRVSPNSGRATPGTTTGSGSDTHQACVNVYNLRFDLEAEDLSIPASALPGTSPAASFDIDNRGNGATPSGGERVIIRRTSNFYRQGTGFSLGTFPNSNPANIAAGGNFSTNWNPSIPSTANVGESWCVRVGINYEEGWTNGSDSTAWSRGDIEECLIIAEQPYIEVHNQGVWAGGEWDPNTFGGSWCTVSDPNRAFIRTVINETIGAAVGAFADYTATAIGVIDEFGTTTVAASGRDTLKFQNISNPFGEYNTDGRCITDYYGYLNKSGPGVTAAPASGLPTSTGQFYANSDWSVGSTGNNNTRTIGDQQITLVVNGDVTINDNIVYNNTYVPGDVPILIIVASGNINIAAEVNQLEGIFISQAQGAGDYGIDTCYNESNILTINTCDEQLTVRGAFVAEDIEFRRTHSGVVRTPHQPAELFDFSYDMYIANPVFVSDIEPNLRASLIRDLPPVY